MNVLVVFGTRPELIKLAPVIRAMRDEPASFDVRICTTAQHRDLLDPLLTTFGIRPDIDLDLMRPDQSPSTVLSRVVAGLTPVLAERPDWIVIQGDTTTTMASALAARYAGIHVAHIEAGLRTGRIDQPFPEEINRRVVGSIADVHFAPTAGARDHLLREGVADEKIVVTGNTAIDALHWAIAQPAPADVEQLLTDAPRDVVLVTAHRRESFGAPLEQICLALRDLADSYGPALRIIVPVHPNPSVSVQVHRLLSAVPGIALTRPLDYLTMVHLLKRARLVLTDSGGVQEEAPSVGTPVLVMRDSTERPEGIAAGTARLVGVERRRIVAVTQRLLDDPEEHARMVRPVNPYGDGQAATRIVGALKARISRIAAALTAIALALAIVPLSSCHSASSAPPPPAAPPASTSPPPAPAPQPQLPPLSPPAQSSTSAKPPAEAPESKIDSQLRVEINRLQGRPAPPGATGVQIDAEQRAFVDVRAEVTSDLIAIVGSAGIVVSSSARDQSILVWLPLTRLNNLATLPNVRAIVPVAQGITLANPARGQEFTLHVGGAVTVVDARITVSLERVTDSRCPVSVKCVSAGDAVLRVGLVDADGQRATVELHTSSAGRRDATFNGRRIRLVQLTPNPPETPNVAQDRYIATLVVTASEPAPAYRIHPTIVTFIP